MCGRNTLWKLLNKVMRVAEAVRSWHGSLRKMAAMPCDGNSHSREGIGCHVDYYFFTLFLSPEKDSDFWTPFQQQGRAAKYVVVIRVHGERRFWNNPLGWQPLFILSVDWAARAPVPRNEPVEQQQLKHLWLSVCGKMGLEDPILNWQKFCSTVLVIVLVAMAMVWLVYLPSSFLPEQQSSQRGDAHPWSTQTLGEQGWAAAGEDRSIIWRAVLCSMAALKSTHIHSGHFTSFVSTGTCLFHLSAAPKFSSSGSLNGQE